MKHLMTLVALLVSTAAVAQIPTLPWNPDENGDQFVGLPDLLGLLTVYGQEFQNAIVAEDGESAIMYMGDMGLIQCGYACENLPGFWTLPTLFDLAPVLSDIGTDNAYLKFDLNTERNSTSNGLYLYEFYSGSFESVQHFTNVGGTTWRCYCTAKQLPRVEYTICATNDSESLLSCADEKVSAGWYPMNVSPQFKTTSEIRYSQAFWRFAQ